MKHFFLLIFFSVFLLFGINFAFGYEEIFWLNNNPKFSGNPTVCIYEPDEKRVRDVIKSEWMRQTEIGIKSWEIALKNSETTDDDKWDIYIERISLGNKEAFDHGNCRVEVNFTGTPLEENPDAIGWEKYEGQKSQITIFYIKPEICGYIFDTEEEKNHPEFCLDDEFRRSKEIGNIAAHEFGHSLGLGHFESSDYRINKKWSLDPSSSPSIMTFAVHYDEEKNKIRKIDVDKVLEIYGYLGFTGTKSDQSNNNLANKTLPTNSESKPTHFPQWIKNGTKWWIESRISNSEFSDGINYLVNNQILVIPDLKETSKLTKIFSINGIAKTISNEKPIVSVPDRFPLTQYFPAGKDPTEEGTPNWILDKEGTDGIVFEDSPIQGYTKNFLKPSDDTILNISIHEFDSGGDAWRHSYADLDEIKEEFDEEIENIQWPSKPSECVGVVEKIDYKDTTTIYCVIDNLRVYVNGIGWFSERETQIAAGIVVKNIQDSINQKENQNQVSEKQVSNSISVTINPTEILLPLRSSDDNLLISGNVDYPKRGIPLMIKFSYPDGKHNFLEMPVTKNGIFSGHFSISSSLPAGKYIIHIIYDDVEFGTISFEIFDEIHDHVRDKARLWVNGQITDQEFTKVIPYLLDGSP